MTDIRKFVTDVDKLKKHTRQNAGKCNYDLVKKDLRNLFDRSTSCPTDLPSSIYEYWENQYIFNSTNLDEEPTQDNIERLAGMLSFMEDTDEYEELLTQDDWNEIARLVNYESEDLPVDILQDLMKVLVSHGAY